MAYHIDEWLSDAKCAGKPDEYDADQVPRANRNRVAWSRCHGCPVLLECAGGALRDRAVGVIRAGVMLPNSPFFARRKLEQLIAAGGPKSPQSMRPDKVHHAQELWDDAECDCCGRGLRPSWAVQEDFPDTTCGASRQKCRTCFNHERNGKSCPVPKQEAA